MSAHTHHDSHDSHGDQDRTSEIKHDLAHELLERFGNIQQLNVLAHGHYEVTFGMIGPEVDGYRPCITPHESAPALEVYLLEYKGVAENRNARSLSRRFEAHRIKPSFLPGDAMCIREKRRELRKAGKHDIPFVILLERFGIRSHLGAGGSKVSFLLSSDSTENAKHLQDLLKEITSEEGVSTPKTMQVDVQKAYKLIIEEASREYSFSEEYSHEHDDHEEVTLSAGGEGH